MGLAEWTLPKNHKIYLSYIYIKKTSGRHPDRLTMIKPSDRKFIIKLCDACPLAQKKNHHKKMEYFIPRLPQKPFLKYVFVSSSSFLVLGRCHRFHLSQWGRAIIDGSCGMDVANNILYLYHIFKKKYIYIYILPKDKKTWTLLNFSLQSSHLINPVQLLFTCNPFSTSAFKSLLHFSSSLAH